MVRNVVVVSRDVVVVADCSAVVTRVVVGAADAAAVVVNSTK